MQLVLLRLQEVEEAAYAVPAAFPVEQVVPFDFGELAGRRVKTDFAAPELLQLRHPRAVFGLGPGFDRPLVQAQVLIRDDQVHVEVDRVSETLASRAGPKRAVEAEECRLGLAKLPAARFAGELLA